jgi:hypothetical protein
MAINVRQLFPLQQARERRDALLRSLLLALMSLLSLGQTGRLAAIGHSITELQQQKTVLMRERNDLLLRLSQAQSLDSVERRAQEMKLRPLTPRQVRYITLESSEIDAPAEP